MELSVSVYADATKQLIETEKNRMHIERLALQRIATMRVDEHIELIQLIIQGHLGAKYIKIWYDVPDENTATLRYEVADVLREAGWHVDEMATTEGIMISNFTVVNYHLQCEYDEYPYKKFEVVNDHTTRINFWVDHDTYSEKTIDRLITLKDCIRVQLWGLLIPKERICKPN